MLTPPLLAEYNRLTRDVHGYDPYVVHPRTRVSVSGEDLKLCGPSKWVGDACINMYMALLQAWPGEKICFQMCQHSVTTCTFLCLAIAVPFQSLLAVSMDSLVLQWICTVTLYCPRNCDDLP